MRGTRWQIIALVISAVVFVAALATRFSMPTTPEQPPEAATSVTAEPTASPQVQPEVQVTATESPTQPISPATSQPISLPVTVDDGVPTFGEALVGTVARLNPLFANLNPVERDITALIYEGLTEINTFGEPAPDLAREWIMSGDGLEYVFTLRDDVIWQDGTPFTADDVVFTFGLLASSDFPGDPALQRFWSTVEVQKLSSHLVRFRLTQPLSSFPTQLTIGILPEHALRGTSASQLVTHPFNLTPVGTGPYQIEALRSDDGQRIDIVDLRVAPNYRQRPGVTDAFTVDRMRFQLFETFAAARDALAAGQVDGLASFDLNERPELLRIAGADTMTTIAPQIALLIYNWDEGEDVRFFRELRVRRALQVGADLPAIVETHLLNRAIFADSPLLPTSWAYTALTLPQADLTVAQQLIDSANIRRGSRPIEATDEEGDPLPTPTPDPDEALYRFDILVTDEPALVAIAQDIANQWNRLGLVVNVEAVPTGRHQQRVAEGDFDAAIVSLPFASDPDVFAYWHVGQYPDGLNYGAMADDRISELLERARRDTNGINRAALYAEFQRAFVDRSVALPLYYPLFTYAVNDRVDGVQLGFIGSPEQRFRNIGEWRIAG